MSERVSPAVAKALEQLAAIQKAHAAQLSALMRRIKPVEKYVAACIVCKSAYTYSDYVEHGGECPREACDSYMSMLTESGLEKANRGRKPFRIADEDVEERTAKGHKEHESTPSRHAPWVGADERLSEGFKYPQLSPDSGTADTDAVTDGGNRGHDPDVIDQPARLKRPQPSERARKSEHAGTIDGVRIAKRAPKRPRLL